jgi:hypothetical protein
MKNKWFAIVMAVMVVFGLLQPAAESGYAADGDGTVVSETRNVALNAIVRATGACAPNEMPQYAVDGDVTTKWCDKSAATNKWLELDLREAYTINQWVVENNCMAESNKCPFWNTKDFRLQKSDDGET